jgi:hypothetical protein
MAHTRSLWLSYCIKANAKIYTGVFLASGTKSCSDFVGSGFVGSDFVGSGPGGN